MGLKAMAHIMLKSGRLLWSCGRQGLAVNDVLHKLTKTADLFGRGKGADAG